MSPMSVVVSGKQLPSRQTAKHKIRASSVAIIAIVLIIYQQTTIVFSKKMR